jgi:hypothetical protein
MYFYKYLAVRERCLQLMTLHLWEIAIHFTKRRFMGEQTCSAHNHCSTECCNLNIIIYTADDSPHSTNAPFTYRIDGHFGTAENASIVNHNPICIRWMHTRMPGPGPGTRDSRPDMYIYATPKQIYLLYMIHTCGYTGIHEYCPIVFSCAR